MDASVCHSQFSLLSSTNETALFLNNLYHFNKAYQPFHGYICLILCTFGILTNALNVVVLTRPNMRSSVNLVLAAIAICDMGTMGSYLIYVTRFYVVSSEMECLSDLYTFAWMSFILFHSLWSIFLHSASLWLAVLLAVMRLAVIRRSKFSSAILRPNNVWKCILYVYMPLGIFCTPIVFTNSIVEVHLPATSTACRGLNGSSTMIAFTVKPSEMALRSDCLLLKSTLWINGIAFKLLPCLVLFFAILGLLQTLSRAKRRKNRLVQRKRLMFSLSDTKRKNAKGNHFSNTTTKMLIAVLSVFVITEMPQALLATMSGVFTDDVYFKIYPLVGDLVDLLSLINSAVNFLLYCAMSSRFRSVFSKLVLPASWNRGRNGESDKEAISTAARYNSTTLNGFLQLNTETTNDVEAFVARQCLSVGKTVCASLSTKISEETAW